MIESSLSNMIKVNGIFLSVFSANSGSGKTTVAINVAATLAKFGYKVCLVDVDLQFGDVSNFLGLKPQCTIYDAYVNLMNDSDNFRIEKFLTDYVYDDISISILPAPHQIQSACQMDIRITKEIIERLRHFDFVILDLASKLNELNIAMLNMSTFINFLGVTDFLPALKNFKVGYDTLKRLGYSTSRIRLIENRCKSRNTINLKDIEKIMDESFFFRFPEDIETTSNFIKSGVPFIFNKPETALSKSFEKFVISYTAAPQQMKNSSEVLNGRNKFLRALSNFFR